MLELKGKMSKHDELHTGAALPIPRFTYRSGGNPAPLLTGRVPIYYQL